MIHRYRKVDQVPELFVIFGIVGIEVIGVFASTRTSLLVCSDLTPPRGLHQTTVYRLSSGKMTSGPSRRFGIAVPASI
jgi:hypothetical protein